ncbi:phosphorylase superfamily [Rubidibacter lacunae KORDI 51-2]|uniref:Phosphorylase superfamily n=1 Tax=Rubidibacter lacunae KORDI 51-2 TaxID=582515 RepID=U5DKB6_9CHRO|nr:phosphorylase superfamily [Rubidibacter lacunae]ERN40135.1 phosphorylase superfamily [Rubidibacter lacunae KORDI 51-2]
MTASPALPISAILVPQGAEYCAVRRGLPRASAPVAIAVPAGSEAIARFVRAHPLPTSGSLLLVGLCGSLSPDLPVGTAVLYRDCRDRDRTLACDRVLTARLQAQLPAAAISSGYTADRVICSVAEKQALRAEFGTDVVDMEGSGLLAALPNRSIAMLRAVSDGCDRDLPDLSRAIDASGQLQPLTVAAELLRQPVASVRFALAATRALSALTDAVACVFAS